MKFISKRNFLFHFVVESEHTDHVSVSVVRPQRICYFCEHTGSPHYLGTCKARNFDAVCEYGVDGKPVWKDT